MAYYELSLVPVAPAPLTDEEIAAIDEAGAKGPSGGVLNKLHKNKYILVVALLSAILIVMLMEYATRRPPQVIVDYI